MKVRILSDLSEQPKEWLLILIVTLSTDIIVLEVSLSVEVDLLGFELSILNISLITDKYNRNVLTDLGQVFVPFWYVLVGSSGGKVKHDDSTVSSDVIALSKVTELLLSGCVPDVHLDVTLGSVEVDWRYFSTLSWNIRFLEFSGDVTLDKGCLSDPSVTNDDEFEFVLGVGWLLVWIHGLLIK